MKVLSSQNECGRQYNHCESTHCLTSVTHDIILKTQIITIVTPTIALLFNDQENYYLLTVRLEGKSPNPFVQRCGIIPKKSQGCD